MAERHIKLKEPSSLFVVYARDKNNRKELNYKKLPPIREQEWAYLEGICILLKFFQYATSIVNGEKYPTYLYTRPLIRNMMAYLENPALFTADNPQNKSVRNFFQSYKDIDGFQEILEDLKFIQKNLVLQMRKRFYNLDQRFLWTPILDPRLRELSHLNDFERKTAEDYIIDEMEDVLRNDLLDEDKTKKKRSVSDDLIVLEKDDEDEEPDFVAHLNIFDSSVKTQTSAADIESVQESVATKNTIMIRQTVLK